MTGPSSVCLRQAPPTAAAPLALWQAPDAEGRDIKRAYYSLMRDVHPDQSGEHEQSTEFCKLLNEVYEASGGDPTEWGARLTQSLRRTGGHVGL
jgi:hypothetical protein